MKAQASLHKFTDWQGPMLLTYTRYGCRKRLRPEFIPLAPLNSMDVPGPVAQSIASLIADPEVMSLILPPSHTFVEINHEIFSMFILLRPLIQEGLLSVKSEIMCIEYWLTA